ncbi:MAG: lytic transglycosylase domain-containing protein [Nitrospirales bacterium]|nr:lytic transglycosylase domain-containing protein [Nitrospirales bacterium]
MMAVLFFIIILFTAMDSRADIYTHVSEDGTLSFSNAPLSQKSKVLIREQEGSKTRKDASSNASKGEGFHLIAEEKAKRHNVDPQLIKAVIRAESNWNPRAVSPKGARGLMQLMPSTAADLGVINSFDPEENIEGGVRYLKYLLEKFKGDLTLALAAYNAGPRKVEQTMSVPAIPETINYVKRVKNLYSGDMALITGPSEKTKGYRIQKVVLKDGTILFTNDTSNTY